MKINTIAVENHPVLGHCSLDFELGGFMIFNLLIGQNGCGKTQVLDLIYECLESGFSPWSDKITRKMTVTFSEPEKVALNIKDSSFRFEYVPVKKEDNQWNSIKVYRTGDNVEVTQEFFDKIVDGRIKNVFRSTCRYSPVEINFSYKKIDSIKASKIDTEEVVTKSSQDLAGVITQLLVDLYNQDAQEALARERNNDGKNIPYAAHEGKYDRFKKAYAKMFDGKKLADVIPSDGEHTILFENTEDNIQFSIKHLSSGEKQVVYRAGYLLSNLGNASSGIVLVDEPELSLHPGWQEKYLTFLEEIFTVDGSCNIQFIIATHSPYVIKGANFPKTHVWQFKRVKAGVSINAIESSWSVLGWGPTLGEITYYAFEIPNTDFHSDLYCALQSKLAPSGKIVKLESQLVAKGQPKEITWKDKNGFTKSETLMTYIRNKIHHPDNLHRPNFNKTQLKDSIERMLKLV